MTVKKAERFAPVQVYVSETDKDVWDHAARHVKARRERIPGYSMSRFVTEAVAEKLMREDA